MHRMCFLWILLCVYTGLQSAESQVLVGADRVMETPYAPLLKGKKIGLITNHTAFTAKKHSTIQLFKTHAKSKGFQLVALFGPEHGLDGNIYADQECQTKLDSEGIPIYSLYGKTRKPTDEMLKGIDLLVYDIQDIGSRSYTYSTTLFYAMEEAAKKKIPVWVLDRPNPLGGLIMDGPMLEEKWRSFVGYINVPYCHGMTIGELAQFFNEEYKVGCQLTVIPMQGWRREMTFQDTGLPWIPTSPCIPEASTTFYYPTTGIIGELQLVSIGIGYTLPFKLIGAPWINGTTLAQKLNEQEFPGVHFEPFKYRPYYGKFAKQDCQGVLILITDMAKFKPVSTQYLILGILKTLYKTHFQQALSKAQKQQEIFNKVNGTEEVLKILHQEQYATWKLLSLHQKEREQFEKKRVKYLIPDYNF
ncbi:DUF1343 domain-containing protein [Parachlamydia sp. AcF125]|uniref:exo-beta-N-acetylmuramidase NamZ family protein n=1 Tax=Parachlamydia sp. AcF125 TaxID=2795736 RepID=UPI001BC90256|nr:DUF1343 domain-containing protein [Parachlamydia sp. AcF125]MBS4167883.1 hypothetical protein [Parachlamydia sp. AcF125]